MEWLTVRLREIHKTGAGLARALGVPKPRVYEMQKGKRRLQAAEIPAAARYLEMSEPELIAAIGGGALPPSSVYEGQFPTSTFASQGGHRRSPLIVWRAASHIGARFGGFMLLAEKEGEVPRPDFLEFNKRAFAFKVIDDSNSPVYNQRDHLLIDPETTPLPEEDCLFTDGIPEVRGALSVVGKLVRSTDSVWVIRQYASKTDSNLPKSTFPNAYPIVGRYHRR